MATACSQGSPPPGFPENVINFVSVAVRQSPVNGVKQAIARAQAGSFDEAALRATVDGYIRDNKVRCTCVLDTFWKVSGRNSRRKMEYLTTCMYDDSVAATHQEVAVEKWEGACQVAGCDHTLQMVTR